MSKLPESLKKSLFFGLGGPLAGPLLYGLTNLQEKEKETPTLPQQVTGVIDNEFDRVNQLIEDGRKRGVSEIEIEISSDLADALSGKTEASFEGMSAGLGLEVKRNGAGKSVLKVKYLELGVTDQLRELHRLHQEGVLTADEFSQAKSKLLAKM